MDPAPRPQMSLTMMLALVACVAVNLWLFRVSIFWGVVALNITKHVAIAALCQVVGVNRKPTDAAPGVIRAVPVPEPSSN